MRRRVFFHCVFFRLNQLLVYHVWSHRGWFYQFCHAQDKHKAGFWTRIMDDLTKAVARATQLLVRQKIECENLRITEARGEARELPYRSGPNKPVVEHLSRVESNCDDVYENLYREPLQTCSRVFSNTRYISIIKRFLKHILILFDCPNRETCSWCRLR